ncbi:MAG: CotS family spore coat protein [Clostridium sp.]|uniref:CotS family spore coat protein n=1 Tax=Clostridium sp. TaxID=1506 RepID=UPI00304CFBD0
MMREFEIERQFDIKIESIKPNKGVYQLKTNKGVRCLKKISYGTQKLLFVCGAKEHLYNNGFKNIDRYYLNTEEKPYALVNEDIYTLSEWIDGRECDFHSDDDLVLSSKALARFNQASKGYEPSENSKLKSDLGRWPHLIEKRIKSFDKMKEMVRKKKNHKTDFDLSYIKSMDYYKILGKKALETLNQSNYYEICRIAEEEKSFCHHDFTYHNIIISENNEVSVIDFDYCKREVRTFDLSNFMIKVLKRRDWDFEVAKLIIDSYNQVSELTKDEYNVLYAFLMFPQRYWRVCNRYYYNEVNWVQNTFNKKLEELIAEQGKFEEFMKNFKEFYTV